MEIIDYLQSKDVNVHENGKNVTRGWVEISCPFCPDGDPSWHLGINLHSELISCWKCKVKGHITLLIMRLENCSWPEAQLIAARRSNRILTPEEEELILNPPKTLLPESAKPELYQKHRKWLINRGFNPDHIHEKYRTMSVGPLGDWRFRLIVPIYMHHRLTGFVGRDTTEKADISYKNGAIEECVISVKNSIYNLDRAKETAIVTEGVTDVWNIGDGCVGLMGKKYTRFQLLHLSKFSRLFIMLDPDALDIANQLAHDMTSLVPDVHVVELDGYDPGEMPKDDVFALRQEIFGKIGHI